MGGFNQLARQCALTSPVSSGLSICGYLLLFPSISARVAGLIDTEFDQELIPPNSIYSSKIIVYYALNVYKGLQAVQSRVPSWGIPAPTMLLSSRSGWFVCPKTRRKLWILSGLFIVGAGETQHVKNSILHGASPAFPVRNRSTLPLGSTSPVKRTRPTHYHLSSPDPIGSQVGEFMHKRPRLSNFQAETAERRVA